MDKVNQNSSIIEVVNAAVEASDKFERLGITKKGREIKKNYIIENYNLYKQVGKSAPHAVASFTTGYPGYNLGLAEIDEQYRYNHELLIQVQKLGLGSLTWKCGGCLVENYHKMPNLKQICYPCLAINGEFKPRKILNRLPDLDTWFVYDDSNEDEFENVSTDNAGARNLLLAELTDELKKRNLSTSDVSPVGSINSMYNISTQLENGVMPKEGLPVDVHVVGLNYLRSLINSVPTYMLFKLSNDPNDLKINPYSLRKTWEFDTTGYNFIFDFLLAFTVLPLRKGGENDQIENNLISLVNETRKTIVDEFSREEMLQVLLQVSGAPAKRRMESKALLNELFLKWKNWSKGDYEKGNWILDSDPESGAPVKI